MDSRISRAAARWPRVSGLALLAILMGVTASTRAATPTRVRVVRGVKVVPGRTWTIFELHLGAAYRYVSHAPAGPSETLQIRLSPVVAVDPGSAAQGQSQLFTWHERDGIPLLDIESVLDARGAARLLVRFERPVEFRVTQPRELDRVRIAIQETATEVDEPEPPPAEVEPRDPASATRSQLIMAEARKAMTAGDFGRAIPLLTEILESPGDPLAPEAKELLGLARQRKGQLAHARAEYEEYLELYPDGEGATRVRQRLRALLTANGRGQRRATRPATEPRGFEHSFSGSVSQFYRSNTIDNDVVGSDTVNSSLDNDLYLTSRHTSGGFAIRTNFSGSYRQDFLDQLDSEDAVRITSGFIDLSSRRTRYSARIGRQSASGGGVLGRFDGVRLSKQLSEMWRLTAVTGFPVDFTESNRIDSDRLFYGLSADVGPLWGHWDTQLFALQQRIHGVEDRSAVGLQVRYVSDRGFGLGLVDYDVSYGEVNTAMGIWNWSLTDATNVNAMVDFRKSPTLTTFNALQGQPVDDFDDLKDLFDDDELRDLAEARTAESRMFTLGASHRLNPTWQLFGDATLSNLSDTEDAGGVLGTEGTGNELYLSLRTTGANLLLEGSYTTFGVRYANTDTSDRYAFSVAGRYPIVDHLRVGPQFGVEYRRNDTASNQWMYRPSLRLDYRWRRLLFELEGGIDFDRGTANDADENEREYFVTIGYRYDF